MLTGAGQIEACGRDQRRQWSSAGADLGQNSLRGEKLGGQPDHEAEHRKAAIPGFGEGDEAETGLGGISQGIETATELNSMKQGQLLTMVMDPCLACFPEAICFHHPPLEPAASPVRIPAPPL